MRERLSAEDWIDAGLRALASAGFTSLKAEVLAQKLNVSRGSFYWHFQDIGAYRTAVMRRWQEVSATAIIEQLEQTAAAGGDRLRLLLGLAFGTDPALEIGMRAWGASDPEARAVVKAVDAQRIDYLQAMLRDAGVGAKVARARAEVLNWAYLGFALSGRPAARPLKSVVQELADFAERRDPDAK